MLEKLKAFCEHPIQFCLNKVLSEKQKEKLARYQEKEDRVMRHIAKHTIAKVIKDEEKLDVIRHELETSLKLQRLLSFLRTIVIVILLILLLCGKHSL